MSEIIIKIEAPEIAQAINNLANALSGKNSQKEPTFKAAAPTNNAPTTQVPTSAMSQPVTPTQTVPVTQITLPAVQMPVSTPATVQAPTSVPSYSIEQFQTAIAPLLDAGKVAQVQQLVQSFGVATLMEIPKERYGEFANGLRGIGGVL